MPIDVPTSDSSVNISSQLNWRVMLLKPTASGSQAVAQNLSDIVSYIQSNARGAAGAQGDAGWAPVIALESDGLRRIAKITDWTGGGGTKPALPDPAYIGATGTVAKASAIDLRGPAGADGTSGGQGVQGLYVLEIFQYAASKPDLPVGGTVDVSAGTVTPPTGWSASIPATNSQNYRLWITRTSVNPATRTADYTPTWSATFEAGSTGPTGAQGPDGKYRVYVYRAAATTPTASGGVYTVATDSFTAPSSWATTPPALSGSNRLYEAFAEVDPGGTATQNLTWSIRAISGLVGPRGHDGKYKAEVFQAGATAPSASGGVYTVSSDTFTAPSGWATTPPNVPSGQRLYIARAEVDPSGSATQNLTWVVAAYSGERGIQGHDGKYKVDVYRAGATAPAASGGVYTVSSDTFTAPSGWSTTPPNVPSGQRLYIARAEVDPGGSATQNLTWDVTAFSGERGATGITGNTGSQGGKGDTGNTGARGDKGWSPRHIIETDGNRRVVKLDGYVGGGGTEPTLPAEAMRYLQASGTYGALATAVDIRGAAGPAVMSSEKRIIPLDDAAVPAQTGTANYDYVTLTATTAPTTDSLITAVNANKQDMTLEAGNYLIFLEATVPDPPERFVPEFHVIEVDTDNARADGDRVATSTFEYFRGQGRATLEIFAYLPLDDAKEVRFRATQDNYWSSAGGVADGGETLTDCILKIQPIGGVKGNEGRQGIQGVQGQSQIRAYRRVATKPAAPTGGTVQVSDGTLSAAPTDWFAAPPMGTANLWISETTFNPAVHTADFTPTNWGDPEGAGLPGAPGTPGKRIAFVYQTAPTIPSISGGGYVPNTDVLTVPTGWSETPTALATGEHVWVSSATLTPGSSTATATPTWSTPQQFSGATGEDGTDGTSGTSGKRPVFVFQTAASAPAITGGSYTPSTDTLTAPTGWSFTPTALSSGQNVYVSMATVTPSSSSTAVTPTWSTVRQFSGAAGRAGKRTVFIFQSAQPVPAIFLDSSYTPNTDTVTPPTNWSLTPPARGDGEHLYISMATVTPSSSSTAVMPTWSPPRQWSGDMGIAGTDGEDGSLGLTDIGRASGLTGSYQNVRDDSNNNITRADVSEIFLVDLDYTRTTADLRMSGIVRKSDLNRTDPYNLQIQGSGGEYIILRFSADSASGVLQLQSQSTNATSINAQIYNIAGGTKGDAGEDGRSPSRGDWDAETTYERLDQAQYDGSLYFRYGARIVGNASNDNPATDTDWRIMDGADATLPATVTQAQAEAGTGTDALMWTPQRVSQAIQALDPGTSFNDEELNTIERLQDIAGDFKYDGDIDDRWSPTARSGWGMVAHVPADITTYVAALTAAGAATDYAAGTAFTSLATGLANSSIILLEIPNADASRIDEARVRMYDDTITGSPNHYLHFSGQGGFNYLGVSGTNRYYYLEVASGWKLQLQHKLNEYVWLGGVEAEEVVEAFTLDPGATLPVSAISGIEVTDADAIVSQTITLSALTLTASTDVRDAMIDTAETENGSLLSNISTTSVTIAEGTYLMEVTFATTSTEQRGYPTMLMRSGTNVVGRTTSQYLRSVDIPRDTTLLGVLNLAEDTAVRPAFVQLQYGTSLGGNIGGAVSITAGATIILHPLSGGGGVTIGGTGGGDSGSASGSGEIKRELVGQKTGRTSELPTPRSGSWFATDIDIPDSEELLMLEVFDSNSPTLLIESPVFTTGKILRALPNQQASVVGTYHAIGTNSYIGLRSRVNPTGTEDINAYFGITSDNKLLYAATNDALNVFTFANVKVWRVYADVTASAAIDGDDLTSLQSIVKELHQVRLLTDDITLDYDSVATEWSVVPSSVVVGARFVATADVPADADAMNTYIAAAESRSPDVPAATDDGWRYDGYLLFRVNKDEDISTWRVAFQDNHSNFDWKSLYLPLGSFAPVGQDSSDTYDIYSIYDGQWPAEDNLDFERQGTAVLSVWHGEYDDDRLQAALTRSSGRQSEDSYLPQNSGSLSNMHVAWGGGHNPLIATDFAPKLLDFEIITPADAMGLGFDSTGSRVKIGSHDNLRGQLHWWDALGVADPNRILMQFTISAAADTDHHYVIGIATNNPAQPSESATWRGWNLFDSGIVLAYIPQETGLTGVHAFYMMSTGDGISTSSSNWENHVARLDAGGWSAVDGVARVTPSTTDAEANARLGMTGTTRLNATARKSIAIEHFDRQTHLYINRTLIGIWNWSADRAPFRSSRANRGYYYLVRSTAFERTLVGGVNTSPATYVSEFAVSPARVQAAAPTYFR